MIVRTLRITTQEIKNPKHDRRCRYGEKAIESLPSGTVFEYIPPRQEKITLSDGTVSTWTEGPSAYVNRALIGGELARLMGQHSVEHTPKTVKELAAQYGFHYNCVAEDILEKLLSDGIVSMTQLDNVMQELFKD